VKRWLFAVGAVGIMVCGFGCAMCESCLDYTYPTYGGSVARSGDMVHGRVGSRFAPAETVTTSASEPDVEQVEPYAPEPELVAPPN
jgi:hypothetical protein